MSAEKEHQNNNCELSLGAKLGLILLCTLYLSPWCLWYSETKQRNELLKEYNSFKKENDYAKKLLSAIKTLTIENQELAKSENNYINLYCTSIKYATKECKDFILATENANVKKHNTETKLIEDLLKPKHKTNAF